MSDPLQDSPEYTGWLEQKKLMGLWSKKYITFKGLVVLVSNDEKSQPEITFDIRTIDRSIDTTGDEIGFALEGPSGDKLILRGTNAEDSEKWCRIFRGGLELAGILKPHDFGLPEVDPRNGLKFIDMPPQYVSRFANLEGSVLYWFNMVKKYGSVKKLSRKQSTEDRIAFLGDKCVYVTKSSSEITRCAKVEEIKRLCTNYRIREEKDPEPFVVIKLDEPEYDIHLSHPDIAGLVQGMVAVYKNVTKGKDLMVEDVKTAQDKGVALNLSKPSGFDVLMVIPSRKDQLKKALDLYAAKRGLKPFMSATQERAAAAAAAQGAVSSGASQPGSAEKPGAAKPAKAEAGSAKSIPHTDPLGVLLEIVGLPQYYAVLHRQGIDLDVIECCDREDMLTFGVNESTHISKIKDAVANEATMAEVRKAVESARSGAGWKKPGPSSSSPGSAPASKPPASSPSSGAAPPIELSDDEFDLPPPKPKAPTNFEITLSDDELDIAPAKPAAKAMISLSSDEEL